MCGGPQIVTVHVFWSVSPETHVGGDGSALSNGKTPPYGDAALYVAAPLMPSLLIVEVPVAVHVWISVYVVAPAVCANVPTARLKPLVVSSAPWVQSDVSAVDGVKTDAERHIQAAGACPGRIMYWPVAFGVEPTAPVVLVPEYHWSTVSAVDVFERMYPQTTAPVPELFAPTTTIEPASPWPAVGKVAPEFVALVAPDAVSVPCADANVKLGPWPMAFASQS
jgi:hypothetical protein